jgi:hydrogenase maturation protease
MKQALVLGVGNTLMADDGIGPAAIAMLDQVWSFSEDVTLTDGGTKGTYLLPLVMESSHLLIIDAIDMKAEPGTVHRLDHDALKKIWAGKNVGTHDASIPELLAYSDLLDSSPKNVCAIGIQQEVVEFSPVRLSDAVSKSMPEICRLAVEILQGWGFEAFPDSKETIRDKAVFGYTEVSA